MVDGILEVTVPGKPKVTVDLKKVVKNGQIVRAAYVMKLDFPNSDFISGGSWT